VPPPPRPQASGSGTSASGTACQTSDLSLQVIQGGTDPDQPSTGSFYIQLTNVSSGTCTLYGLPGVDLLSSNGASLGMKDDWTVKLAMSGGEKVQTLAPDAASVAAVDYAAKPAAQTAGDPQAVEVQVIPPNQTTALTAKIDNLYQGDIQIPVVSKTLTTGPMDINGVPHAWYCRGTRREPAECLEHSRHEPDCIGGSSEWAHWVRRHSRQRSRPGRRLGYLTAVPGADRTC
jgi:hypothetical protein